MKFPIPRRAVSAWMALWRRTPWSRRTARVKALARQIEARALALADGGLDQRLPEPYALPALLAHVDELLAAAGDEAARRNADVSAGPEDAPDPPRDLVSGIIDIRDALVSAIGDVAPESRHVVEAMDRKLLRLLKRHNVTPFEQQGPFDSACHQARGTRETADPALHDHVAETFRVGYRSGDVLLRPHEVFLYSHHREESVPESL